MLKKVNAFINILMGALIGAFAGSAIYKYFDYKNGLNTIKRPETNIML